MKNRLYVLGFAALLLMGTWGKAHAQPAGPAAAPGAKVVAPMAAPSCQASLPDFQSLDLISNTSPEAVTCGSCSYSSCQGMTPNSLCLYPAGLGTYRWGRCVINSWCSEDNTSYCDCTNDPPQ